MSIKKKSQFEHDSLKHIKSPELFDLYRKYIEAQGFIKKLKRWANLSNISGKRSSAVESMDSSPTSKCYMNKNQQIAELEKTIKNIVDEIMHHENKVYASSRNTRDYSIDDKFLLLHHNGSTRNFFRHGVATYKKVRDAKSGDSIAEICLTTDLTVEHTIIAAEDLHLITLTKENWRTLALSRVPTMIERKEFFWKTFPNLTIESIIKLSAYLEERMILNWDHVYREGDEPDAIYIVKSGEVQVKKDFLLG